MRNAQRSLVVPLLLLSIACAGRNVNTTPQPQIARYGTDITMGLGAVQEFVVRASSGPMPALSVEKATPIMNRIRSMYESASQLSTALKEYDALTNPAERQVKASEIQTILSAISVVAKDIYGQDLPSQLAAEGARLIGNMNATISTIKTAVAAGRL